MSPALQLRVSVSKLASKRDEPVEHEKHIPWDYADDGAPAEADTAQREEGHVETIGDLLRVCQHLGVVVGNVVWNLLLDLLHLAMAVWDFGKVGVLALLLAFNDCWPRPTV